MYLAAFDDAVFLGEDDGSVRRGLPDRRPTCVAAAERRFCGTTDGLYRERADGDGFERVYEGHVTSVAVAPDGTLYVGTEPTALARSTDGGDSWTACADPTTLDSADEWAFPPRPDTHHARAVAVADGTLYVAVEAGALVRSFDGGDSWVDRVPGGPRDTHTLATHPDAPGRVYAAAGDGFFVSDDGGDSWTRRESGLDRRYCWSVAVDPADADLIYCSAAAGPGPAHGRTDPESYVYRSDDAGRSWTRLDGAQAGEGTTRPVLVVDDAVFSLSNRGLHRSDDEGETWRRVAEFPVEVATASGLLVG